MASYVALDNHNDCGAGRQDDCTDESHAGSASARQCENTLRTSFNNDVLAEDQLGTSVTSNLNPPSLSSEQEEADSISGHQRTAEQLRARLIAQRQNASTRNLEALRATPAPNVDNVHLEPTNTLSIQMKNEPLSDGDLLSLDYLLAEGRAAAEAINAENAARVSTGDGLTHTSLNGSVPKSSTIEAADARLSRNVMQLSTSPDPRPTSAVLAEAGRALIAPPCALNDSYYNDLHEWLEMTGYHDVTFRTAKLAPYKERTTLEKEALRIRKRLEKLREEEQAVIDALRSSMARPALHYDVARPPLPNALSILDDPPTSAANASDTRLQPTVQGLKRRHSPEHSSTDNTTHHNKTRGFRFRGANELSEHRSGALGTPTEPKVMDRQVSHHEPCYVPSSRASNNSPLDRGQAPDHHDVNDQPRSQRDSDPSQWRQRKTSASAMDNRYDHNREIARYAPSYDEHDFSRPPPRRGNRLADMHGSDSYTYSRR